MSAAADAVADDAEARRAEGAAAATSVAKPPKPTPGQRERMQEIVRRSEQVLRNRLSKGAPERAQGRARADVDGAVHYRVFVSRAMGWPTLKTTFKRLSSQSNVEVLFRGIPKGAKIDTAIREVARRTRKLKTIPPIRIDPPAFTKAQVKVVPTVTATRGGEIIARAIGTSSVRGIKRRLEEGRNGDYGQLGPVVEISEPNLIDVMKARAAQLDMAALRERAKQSYWDGLTFHRLPAAQKERRRAIDPTVTVQRNITTPSGQVIARKGETLNPLEMKPFSKRAIVFDATDPRQRRAAEVLAEGSKPVVFLATEFESDRGWTHYREVASQLDHPVYRLTKGLRKRWRLERVPAVVTADNGRFIVREVPADRFSDPEVSE